MTSYFFESALLPDGWHDRVRVTVENGRYSGLETGVTATADERCFDVVVPKMPNCHSHVFQRAMAGLSEYRSQHGDDFWSWRDLMYRLANQITTEALYQTAKNCYQQMKDAGYAQVCEFHYLHRAQHDSSDYLSHSQTILKAARAVGLPITLLPVLYAHSGVGGSPLMSEQQRFGLSVDEYLDLHHRLRAELTDDQSLGICFHSIRAVDLDMMRQVLDRLPDDLPVHIHIAEQQAEIEQSLAYYGQRPVAWLLDHFDVNRRWCLVHATHLDASEVRGLAASGAVAGLCPLTEANLGDGVFSMPEYMAHRGRLAIGSDSHIELNPAGELKMLEYSQRLQQQQRNVCCDSGQPHVATWLWLQAVAGGNQVCGQPVAGIQVGQQAGIIAMPKTSTHSPQTTLDAWVFSDWLAPEILDLK